MRIRKDKCNQCGKETDDYYNEFGWLRLQLDSISVMHGRDSKNNARTKYVSYTDDQKLVDFCSKACFEEWLKFFFTPKTEWAS